MRYTLFCKHCGTRLMKSGEPVLATLQIEIKCPNQNCKKILNLPDDVLLKAEEKEKIIPGLDSR